MDDRKFLAAVFSLCLMGGSARPDVLADRMGCDAEWVGSKLGDLRRRGLLKRSGAGFALTARGRRSIRVVLIGGGFEVIHAGHIYTIDQAKKQGDALVAVVARDSTVRRGKGRDPVTTEVERRKLLSSLRQVDAAILGVKGNIYRTLERVKPDVVALGYDQRHSESEIVREAALRGISLKVVRLDTPHPKLKTSRLLNEL